MSAPFKLGMSSWGPSPLVWNSCTWSDDALVLCTLMAPRHARRFAGFSASITVQLWQALASSLLARARAHSNEIKPVKGLGANEWCMRILRAMSDPTDRTSAVYSPSIHWRQLVNGGELASCRRERRTSRTCTGKPTPPRSISGQSASGDPNPSRASAFLDASAKGYGYGRLVLMSTML